MQIRSGWPSWFRSPTPLIDSPDAGSPAASVASVKFIFPSFRHTRQLLLGVP